jgi:hypothetical protein
LAFVIAADLDWLEQHAVDRDELIDLCVRTRSISSPRLGCPRPPHHMHT